MALVELLLAFIVEPKSWVSLLFGILTAYVVYFYNRVRQLPPGPFPFPFVGNIPQLRSPLALYEKAIKWSQRYGDPFTVWIGPRPFVIAATQESFKDISGPLRNLLAGRPSTVIGDFQKKGRMDIVFSDFDPSWDVLRRLAHVAMRKYAQTEKLASLCASTVDDEIDSLFVNSTETKYEIVRFIENIVNNILAISNFGEGFQKGDVNYETMRQAGISFEEHAPNGLPSDIHPLLAYLFYKTEAIARKFMNVVMDIIEKMFEKSKKSWVKGVNRHFTDTLLNAREEFLAEDRASAKYLTDDALTMVVFNIFGAGTNTSRSILGFTFLTLATEPNLQEQLRKEIFDNIGTRRCTLGDRPKMPTVDAFLQEIIRLYPPGPLSLPRKTLAEVTVNGRTIPKECAFLIDLWAVNRDKAIWGADADEFRYSRFLEASKDQLGKGATSFGIGARSCPAEKMAQADMFYALVRTLQRVRISGFESVDLRPKDSDILLDPRRQDLMFTKLEV